MNSSLDSDELATNNRDKEGSKNAAGGNATGGMTTSMGGMATRMGGSRLMGNSVMKGVGVTGVGVTASVMKGFTRMGTIMQSFGGVRGPSALQAAMM